MESTASPPASLEQELCLRCGLCCNGVIFADVRLKAGDSIGRFKDLGLAVRGRAYPRLAQPCAALEGCRCRIYRERPEHCRQFECLLFRRLAEKQVDFQGALRWVAGAQARAEKVRMLLRKLGDTEETAPLSARFRDVARRSQKEQWGAERSTIFADLTLADHELTRFLGKFFYPTPRG